MGDFVGNFGRNFGRLFLRLLGDVNTFFILVVFFTEFAGTNIGLTELGSSARFVRDAVGRFRFILIVSLFDPHPADLTIKRKGWLVVS